MRNRTVGIVRTHYIHLVLTVILLVEPFIIIYYNFHFYIANTSL